MMIDDTILLTAYQAVIGCMIIGSILGVFLAHEFPIRWKTIKIKEDKK